VPNITLYYAHGKDSLNSQIEELLEEHDIQYETSTEEFTPVPKLTRIYEDGSKEVFLGKTEIEEFM